MFSFILIAILSVGIMGQDNGGRGGDRPAPPPPFWVLPRADDPTPAPEYAPVEGIASDLDREVTDGYMTPDIKGLESIQEIQDYHLDIIRLDNVLDHKLSQLEKKIESGIENGYFTIEEAKRVLGWREVQTLFHHQYEKGVSRKEWDWQGSWKAKFKRTINGGPLEWIRN